MIKLDNIIVMTGEICQGSFDDYIEAAEEIADKHGLPVLVRPPCRRQFVVLPRDGEDE